MANKTYVGILDGNHIDFVTRFDPRTNEAFWDAGLPAKPIAKKTAEDIAFGLRWNGYNAVLISAPDHKTYTNDIKWFGTVKWCDEDICVALEDCGIEEYYADDWDDIVGEIHARLENHHALADLMTEAGWEVIHHVVRDYLQEKDAIDRRAREEGHDLCLIHGIDDIDEDCIRCFEDFIGRRFKTYDEYKEIDGQMDDMILDYDTREEWLAAYPALAKYVKN